MELGLRSGSGTETQAPHTNAGMSMTLKCLEKKMLQAKTLAMINNGATQCILIICICALYYNILIALVCNSIFRFV